MRPYSHSIASPIAPQQLTHQPTKHSFLLRNTSHFSQSSNQQTSQRVSHKVSQPRLTAPKRHVPKENKGRETS
ncbi:hypothetical protein E2C01_043497 [Portunus trituberculatus]|uniref:Uncharacterized protein n=1 Tax=Portunus trituberculatus TaxID=210409 RepID=A0A5B7FVW4_PORTR|nr:hypothetical protein [Portunus trituberculatus]